MTRGRGKDGGAEVGGGEGVHYYEGSCNVDGVEGEGESEEARAAPSSRHCGWGTVADVAPRSYQYHYWCSFIAQLVVPLLFLLLMSREESTILAAMEGGVSGGPVGWALIEMGLLLFLLALQTARSRVHAAATGISLVPHSWPRLLLSAAHRRRVVRNLRATHTLSPDLRWTPVPPSQPLPLPAPETLTAHTAFLTAGLQRSMWLILSLSLLDVILHTAAPATFPLRPSRLLRPFLMFHYARKSRRMVTSLLSSELLSFFTFF